MGGNTILNVLEQDGNLVRVKARVLAGRRRGGSDSVGEGFLAPFFRLRGGVVDKERDITIRMACDIVGKDDVINIVRDVVIEMEVVAEGVDVHKAVRHRVVAASESENGKSDGGAERGLAKARDITAGGFICRIVIPLSESMPLVMGEGRSRGRRSMAGGGDGGGDGGERRRRGVAQRGRKGRLEGSGGGSRSGLFRRHGVEGDEYEEFRR